MAFNAANRVPDVYIDEIQLPGPITGVGTSTAAFIGPALAGPPNKPTLLTNFTQFLDSFGPDVSDLDPNDPARLDPNRAYIATPAVFVTHAVRGFFDNGGSACFFVRTSKAHQASLALDDETNAPALLVTARKEGTAGNDIKVSVSRASIAAALEPDKVFNGNAAVGVASFNQEKTQAVLDNPATFQPGDTVVFEETINGNAEKEVAVATAATATTLTLKAGLTKAFTAAATVRIADLSPGSRKFRLKDVTGVEAGSYLHISQTIGNNPAVEEDAVVESVNAKQITLANGLTNSYLMGQADPAIAIKSLEFKLTVDHKDKDNVAVSDSYDKLSMEPRHSRYFRKVIDTASPTPVVSVTRGSSTAGPPKNIPKDLAQQQLANGADENISALADNDYINSLATLEAEDDVNMICIPDSVSAAVQGAMIAHCEKMQDRFAILDPAAGDLTHSDIQNQRNNLGSDRGFAAIYYPRISISNPLGGDPLVVPPSGHIAGVFARTDESKGVHKAPANEQLRGALTLDAKLTLTEMGRLNEQSINVLRVIPGGGIKVWGARTIAKNTQWRYVNIRRLLLFIEESIQEGTQFCVFEPNDLALRQKVVRLVTDFLTRAWRDGALFGATPDQAFRVRADDELNPPDLRALGQLVIEVIVVPTTPAEFIVFRIISDPTGNVLIEQ